MKKEVRFWTLLYKSFFRCRGKSMVDKMKSEYWGNGMDAGTAISDARKMTREIWLQECFPEWHHMLNQQIENMQVPKRSFALWMLGGPSWAFKSSGGVTFLIDNYSGSSSTSKYSSDGACRMTGASYLSWLRINPHVIDPWKFNRLDAVFATHPHSDHADFYTVSATLQTTDCKFVGPKNVCALFRKWNVPEDRIIEVKPGDTFKIKDVSIYVEKNYDYMACMTGDYKISEPFDFDANAVSFILESGGHSVIFVGDTLYNDGFTAVGHRHKIDIVIAAMGHNAPGISDKMNPWDVMRVAQNLRAKIVIPDHYENWSSSAIDPHELQKIVDANDKNLKTCIMKSGGIYVYPRDKDMREYIYPDWRERYDWEKSIMYGTINKTK